MNFLIRITAIFLLTISVLSFFWKPQQENHSKNLGHSWEEYDSAYFHRFPNIQSLINYSDSSLGADKKNTLGYNNLVAQLVSKRFYHGYSYYDFSTSPLSFLAGRLIWNNLSAIVIPDDIMKHPMAACSQQSIVLMEVFKRNKISFRKVAFHGHFAVEGFIENKWRFFDTDMEPKLSNERESAATLDAENKLIPAYANTNTNLNFLRSVLKGPIAGKINDFPAPRAMLFHKLCFIMTSKWFLLFLFLLSFLSFKLPVLNKKPKSITAKNQNVDNVLYIDQLAKEVI